MKVFLTACLDSHSGLEKLEVSTPSLSNDLTKVTRRPLPLPLQIYSLCTCVSVVCSEWHLARIYKNYNYCLWINSLQVVFYVVRADGAYQKVGYCWIHVLDRLFAGSILLLVCFPMTHGKATRHYDDGDENDPFSTLLHFWNAIRQTNFPLAEFSKERNRWTHA